jgi:hypothetical protein
MAAQAWVGFKCVKIDKNGQYSATLGKQKKISTNSQFSTLLKLRFTMLENEHQFID